MSLPNYEGSATPVAITAVSAVAITLPTTPNVGDFIIAQIELDATSGTPDVIPPDASWVELATDVSGKLCQALYGHFWDGTELAAVTFTTSLATVNVGLFYGQTHRFSNVAATSYLNPGSGGTANSTSVLSQTLTTVGLNRLGLTFVSLEASTAATASFTGETGGDWVEKTSVSTSTGTKGRMQMQTAALASPVTISGGAYSITKARWISRSIALVGGDPVLVGSPLALTLALPDAVITGPPVLCVADPLNVFIAFVDADFILPLVGDPLALTLNMHDIDLSTDFVLVAHVLALAIATPNATLLWSVSLVADALALTLDMQRGELQGPAIDVETAHSAHTGLGPGVWRGFDEKKRDTFVWPVWNERQVMSGPPVRDAYRVSREQQRPRKSKRPKERK